MDEQSVRVLLVISNRVLRGLLAMRLLRVHAWAVDVVSTFEAAQDAITLAQGTYAIVVTDVIAAELITPGLPWFGLLQQAFPNISWIVCNGDAGSSAQINVDERVYGYACRPDAISISGLVDLMITLIDSAGVLPAMSSSGDELDQLRSSFTFQASSRDLKALLEVTQSINSLHTIDSICETTCRIVVEMFEIDHSGFVIFTPDAVHGIVVAEYPTLEARGKLVPVRGVPIEEHLIATQEPIVIDDVTSVTQLGPVRETLRELGIRSILIIPLVYKGKVLGSFSLDSIGHYQRFTDDDIAVCKIIAAQVAAAIEHASLYNALEQQAAQLTQLSEIGSNLNAARDLDAILQALADHIVRLVDAKRSLMLLLDPGQCHLIKLVGCGYPQAELPHPSIEAIHTSVSGKVLKTGRSIALQRADHALLRSDYADQAVWSFEAGPLLVVPVIIKTQVVGTLIASADERRSAFSTDDLRLVEMLSHQAATAIENAQLYQHHIQRTRLLTALDTASEQMRAEKETAKLLQETLRLAVELVEGSAGALYLNWLELHEVETYVLYKLPSVWLGSRQPHGRGLAGRIAELGHAIIMGEAEWSDDEALFQTGQQSALMGMPLKHVGEVEAVLIITIPNTDGHLHSDKLQILERFASHASLALHTSRLMDQDQRRFTYLKLLNKLSIYIQGVQDLDTLAHVVLTGITAGYGLAFNRAAIFLCDESCTYLVGCQAIGHLNEQEALLDWASHQQRGWEDFAEYLTLLTNNSLPSTSLGEHVRRMQWPILDTAPDALSQAVLEQRVIQLTPDDKLRMPEDLRAVWQPVAPTIIVPLISTKRLLGVLIADNAWTHTPITGSDQAALISFANTAAITIANAQLLKETSRQQNRLAAFFTATNALISAQAPHDVLQTVVDQARIAAEAAWVGVFLIDERGSVRNLIMAGPKEEFDMIQMIRPNGRSMRVMRTGIPEIIGDVAGEASDDLNPNLFERQVKAALCLPLSLQGKRIGVMWIHYIQPQAFTASDIETIQLYVNQAAIAYDNARRINELEHMRGAAEALAGAENLKDVLTQIVRNACYVLQAQSSAVFTFDSARRSFVYQASVGRNGQRTLRVGALRAAPRPGGTADTIIDQGWVEVEDTHDTERYAFLGPSTQQFLEQIDVRSFIGTTLRIEDEIVGVLYIDYKQPRRFTDEERAAVQTFAQHAALAYSKTKLIERITKVYRWASTLARVTVLGKALPSTLQVVTKSILEVLECDAVALYEYDESNDTIDPVPSALGFEALEGVTLSTNATQRSLVYELLKLNHITMVENTAEELIVSRHHFIDEIAAFAAIPLRVGEQAVGILFVCFRAPHRFAKNEQKILELLANQAAVAIQNAHLYQALSTRVQELEHAREKMAIHTALAYMGMIHATRHHTIRNVAVVIKDAIVLVTRHLAASALDALPSRLSLIQAKADEILNMQIQAPLSRTEAVAPMLINQFLRDHVEQHIRVMSVQGIKLDFVFDLDDNAAVQVNQEWFRESLYILLDNAVRAMTNSLEKALTLVTRQVEQRVQIDIVDTGEGMPQDIAAQLFQRQISNPENNETLGMGVLIAQAIVETYDGKIELLWTTPQGTGIRIWLPLAV